MLVFHRPLRLKSPQKAGDKADYGVVDLLWQSPARKLNSERTVPPKSDRGYFFLTDAAIRGLVSWSAKAFLGRFGNLDRAVLR